MHPSQWLPYVLLVGAGVALVAAVWFAVRHPASQAPIRRPAWQTAQAALAALTASTAALCVLSALALFD